MFFIFIPHIFQLKLKPSTSLYILESFFWCLKESIMVLFPVANMQQMAEVRQLLQKDVLEGNPIVITT